MKLKIWEQNSSEDQGKRIIVYIAKALSSKYVNRCLATALHERKRILLGAVMLILTKCCRKVSKLVYRSSQIFKNGFSSKEKL